MALRVPPHALGGWSVVPGLLGLVLAGLVWLLARRRATALRTALLAGQVPTSGGRLRLLLAVLVAAAAAVGAVVALPGLG